MSSKLRKSRTDKMLAGVCGGFAEYLGWDPTLVRILFAVILISSFGTAVLVYFILAIIMPE
ncbi:PspC domain-containing protein [Gracilimonas mengyeensis]|uniref:Phage shock protein C (PspC) family protein n=1 Tax=Gracilimonas mengyeensis TaxID=1302730 RepID=A0A521DBW7_9BACT|nr:PspC domain-containing protein [Gracilimonas mengyeensis]SMO69173.1 phage shock protein C (PspC) family protein [Gracilimonas mengyeensis]